MKWQTEEYRKVKELYVKAFPEAERFHTWQLLVMALRKKARFQAIYNETEFVGLIFLVEGETAVYLAYLAIISAKHGQGYGTKVLQALRKNYYNKDIILDIEPINSLALNYNQRVKRLHFYERNGFKQTGKKLIDAGGQYAIMTTGTVFKAEILNQLLHYMSFGLHKFKVE
ncbi:MULTISPECIES: GNAT family N-acetyltransferase [Lactobacillus]|uniref:GNAT family N-acetyltransferase n=1 Tax=Lactobacillus TaxID=1578 RepID=UPI00351A79C9